MKLPLWISLRNLPNPMAFPVQPTCHVTSPIPMQYEKTIPIISVDQMSHLGCEGGYVQNRAYKGHLQRMKEFYLQSFQHLGNIS